MHETGSRNELSLLFVCTHNRCRSILCEALARHLGGGRIAAFSAGSEPSGVVHPDTLAQLEKRGIDGTGLRSESWDDYADQPLDAVITVCDRAAGEACPLWMGQTPRAHWGLPDPSRVEGEAERDAAFDAVIATIEQRVARLLQLDVAGLRGAELVSALHRITEEEP